MSFICIVCRDLLSNNPRDVPEGASAVGHSDIVVTKCGHLYHLVCLHDWFNRQTNPRQECPYCKTVVQTGGHQRIFPIGDEETDELNSQMKKVKEATKQSENLKHEISQFEVILNETGTKLEEANLSLDILNYEYNLKVSELESQTKNFESIVDSMENNFAGVVNTLTLEKDTLAKNIDNMKAQLAVYQKAENEQRHRRETLELVQSQSILMDSVKRLTEKLDTGLHVGASPSQKNIVKHSIGSQTEKYVQETLEQLLESVPREEMLQLYVKFLDSEKNKTQSLLASSNNTPKASQTQVQPRSAHSIPPEPILDRLPG